MPNISDSAGMKHHETCTLVGKSSQFEFGAIMFGVLEKQKLSSLFVAVRTVCSF